MRVVADTNVVVSGLLWTGGPRLLLDAARVGLIELMTSPTLLTELEDVLNRPKFADRLRQANVSVVDVVQGFAALATVVEPGAIKSVIADDPDDDHVLACALVAEAVMIVSGDHHLLSLREYRGVSIVPVSDALLVIDRRS